VADETTGKASLAARPAEIACTENRDLSLPWPVDWKGARAGAVLRRVISTKQPFCAALLAGLISGLTARYQLSAALRLVVVCPCLVLVPDPHILNGGRSNSLRNPHCARRSSWVSAQYHNTKGEEETKHREERKKAGDDDALSMNNNRRHAWREFLLGVFVFA
jgi:hypothetical protein